MGGTLGIRADRVVDFEDIQDSEGKQVSADKVVAVEGNQKLAAFQVAVDPEREVDWLELDYFQEGLLKLGIFIIFCH